MSDSGGKKGICPFSLFLFAASTGYYVYSRSITVSEKREEKRPEGDGEMAESSSFAEEAYRVIFVLGGPGAGKGTQCSLIQTNLGWGHLSAGDLLRAERNSGSQLADVINAKISSGQLVPSDITVGLLKDAMDRERKASGCTKFLIDGFPRSDGNVSAWETVVGSAADVCAVLFLDCPEDVMTGRLLERGKTSGRNDDELDVIRKRFDTFRKESVPVIQRYESEGLVRRVAADRDPDSVWETVRGIVESL